MKIVKASYFIEKPNVATSKGKESILNAIESAARTCYKSEDRIQPGSAEALIKRLIASGHEAMLEHAFMTVRFIVDRGVSHELVRHRVASFAQESTRYCNYGKEKFGKEITFIKPAFWEKGSEQYKHWSKACSFTENAYFKLLEDGATPQEARAVLPNSLKTEIVVTANVREWRHIFKLRTAKDAHPQMREVMAPLLAEMTMYLPELFGDIQP